MAEKKEGLNGMSENEKREQTASDVTTGKPAKAEKKEAKKKDAKPGFFARAGKWFKEMKSELKKVQWPGFKSVMKNTGVVIVCVIIVGVFIWGFDLLASNVVGALLHLAGKG